MSAPDFDHVDAEIRAIFAEELAEQLEVLRRPASTRVWSGALGAIARSAELVGAPSIAQSAARAAALLASHPTVTADAAAAVRSFSSDVIAFAAASGVAKAKYLAPVDLAVGAGEVEKPWWRFW